MSYYYLQLIPSNRHFIPTIKSQKKAANFLFTVFPHKGNRDLDGFPDFDGIKFNDFGTVQFICSGDNNHWVVCSSCSRKFTWESEDLRTLGGREFENIWRETWALAEKCGCEGLTLDMPCCSHVVNITDLTFHSPGGFACFMIRIDGRKEPLRTDVLSGLEEILGCKILQIPARV